MSLAPSIDGWYVPLVGDFDADGDDDIYWYEPGGRGDGLWLASGGNFRAVAVPRSGPGYTPVAGDYDGDGDDDIVWSLSGTTAWMWVANRGYFTSRPAPPTYGFFVSRAGDYDGDGDDDIFWYGPGGGGEFVWTAQGGSFAWWNGPPVSEYYTSLNVGDFDGNGGDDLFWYKSPGADSVWWDTGTGMFGRSAFTNTAFR